MGKIETPKVLVCLSYNSLFIGYESVNPIQLIQNIPSLKALEYITTRTNNLMYAFSDTDKQIESIYEMSCFFDDEVRVKATQFIGKYDNPYMIDMNSTFLFYMLILQNYNTETRLITNDDIINIYKAYLYCSQLWTDKQINVGTGFSSLVEAAIRIDLPIVEFKLYKDFKPQIYKASRFFQFCDTDVKFKEFVKWFYEDKGVSNQIDYITRLFSFYSSTLDSIYVKIPQEFLAQISFFDQFTVELQNCSDIWNNKNMNYLRDHFLLKIDSDTYLVLNSNLLVDKLYQGLIFDFWKVIEVHNGTNRKGKLIKNFGDFKSVLGDEFSETMIFYNLMEMAFGSLGYVQLTGNNMKSSGIIAEPDYYMRKDNNIFLFEYKDIIIKDDVKNSDDFEYITTEILNKICKDSETEKKGGAQLLFNLNRIYNEHLLDNLDQQVNENTIAYPIIVVNDRAFDSLGINYLFAEKFNEIIVNKYPSLIGKLHDPIIISIDALFSLTTRLKNGTIDLQNLLDDYNSIYINPQTSIMSLSTFLADYYPPTVQTQDDINYLFGSLFHKIGEIVDDESNNGI